MTGPRCRSCGVTIEAHWQLFEHVLICRVREQLNADAAGLERRFRARQHTRAVERAKRYHLPVFDWRRAHAV